jgi:ABC-type transport system involved in multi-copper enzyme maturation permease subunit
VTAEIARQELRDVVFGWSLYLTVAVAVLVGAVLVYNTLRSVADSGLEIVSHPLSSPVLVAMSLAALFLAAWATLSIARPRDQGALRVLFFGPVDAAGLVGGHLLAALVVYGLFMLIAIPLLALLGLIANLPLPPALLPGLLVSPLLVLPAVGIGLFISAIAPSGRSALFLFVIALAFVLVVQLGYSALLQIPPTSRYYDALLFLREAVRVVRDALRWISPLALVSEGLDAAYRADWQGLAQQALAGLAGVAVWSALAVWALQRRGVLP